MSGINTLKIFVGIDGFWVLCEKFPDDERHGGLNELLDDFILDNVKVEESMGFYAASFEVEQKPGGWRGSEYDEAELVMTKLERNK